MKSVVLYGSTYGTARRYAEKLSQRAQANLYAADQAGNLSGYQCVVYVGALYAGNVQGLKEAALSFPRHAKICIVTVGLESVGEPSDAVHIREGIRKQVPSEVFERAQFFHLPGCIDYHRLNLKHRLMMTALQYSLRANPEDQRTDDDRAVLETYNKKLDRVDFGKLAPIAAYMMQE